MKGFCPINYISRLHPAVFIEAIKITAGTGWMMFRVSVYIWVYAQHFFFVSGFVWNSF